MLEECMNTHMHSLGKSCRRKILVCRQSTFSLQHFVKLNDLLDGDNAFT